MTDLTITGLALKTDQLLSRVDALLLGRVLTASQSFRTETADADPGAGRFRLNNATLANVTAGYFDDLDTDGTSLAPLIDTYDDSTSATKGTLILASLDNAENWAAFRVTGTVVDGTGYRKMTLAHIVSNGTWTADEVFAQDFKRAGDIGQANTLTIGTVTEGAVAAEITGTAPSQTLNLTIPKGGTGDTGDAPNITIGTVEEGTAAVAILGTNPNYVLNFTVPKGATGDTGARGFSLIYGTGVPDPGEGVNNEFYIDTDTWGIYGPKAFDLWPAGVNIIGPPGSTGDAGSDGNTVLSGSGAPGAGIGVDDDFYYDFTNVNMYGPRSASGWGDPTSLKGPAGAGSGDVIGPTGSVANRLAVFNGTSGKIIKDGGISVEGIQTNLDARTGLNPLKISAFTFTRLGPRVLVDTTSAAITGTLPASPAVGERCLFSDVADFSVNALTIGRNGELIEGVAADMTVSTKNTSGGFVFVGGSTGWKAIKS